MLHGFKWLSLLRNGEQPEYNASRLLGSVQRSSQGNGVWVRCLWLLQEKPYNENPAPCSLLFLCAEVATGGNAKGICLVCYWCTTLLPVFGAVKFQSGHNSFRKVKQSGLKYMHLFSYDAMGRNRRWESNVGKQKNVLWLVVTGPFNLSSAHMLLPLHI